MSVDDVRQPNHFPAPTSLYLYALGGVVRRATEFGERIDQAEAAPDQAALDRAIEDLLEGGIALQSALGLLLSLDRETEWAHELFIELRDHLRSARSKLEGEEDERSAELSALRDLAERAEGEVKTLSPVPESPPENGVRARPVSRVAIARTDHQSVGMREIEGVVRDAVRLIGGIERFVESGQTVLIKPSQMVPAPAHSGVTTDPRVVRILIRLAKEAGASRVIIGEASAAGMQTARVLEATGMKEAVAAEGAELIPFDECASKVVEIGGGEPMQLELPEPLLEADVVINVPKLRVGNLDPIYGALENWSGCLRPEHRGPFYLYDSPTRLAELISYLRPALTVMDAIFVGEGSGPLACEGRFLGTVLASTDPVAVDITAARILEIDPQELELARAAAQLGLGTDDPGEVELIGTPLEDLKTSVALPPPGLQGIDARVLVGLGVTYPGTVSHFKGIADLLTQLGLWRLLRDELGRLPTIMLGAAEDPLFEEHLTEGPYIVIDDAALDHYRTDPRTYSIPGHPVLGEVLPHLLTGLGIGGLGRSGREIERRLGLGYPAPPSPGAPNPR